MNYKYSALNPSFWFIRGRLRLPFWSKRLGSLVPQPRWLRRLYYRKSYEWWGHPSNYHWKGWELDGYGDGQTKGPWALYRPSLLPGERDLWSGNYYDQGSDERAS